MVKHNVKILLIEDDMTLFQEISDRLASQLLCRSVRLVFLRRRAVDADADRDDSLHSSVLDIWPSFRFLL